MNLVGHINRHYGKQVDDKVIESQFRREEIAGQIEQHYGVSLVDAYEMVDDWADTALVIPIRERYLK